MLSLRMEFRSSLSDALTSWKLTVCVLSLQAKMFHNIITSACNTEYKYDYLTGLDMEGIYRKNGQYGKVTELLKDFYKGCF